MLLNNIYTVDYQVLPNGVPLEDEDDEDYNGIIDAVTDDEKQFVTYQVDYTKDQTGVNMTAYLVEV